MSVDNLKRTLALATPADHAAGRQSFIKYNRIITALAAKTGYTPRIAAAVFAALSLRTTTTTATCATPIH